jgi:hypothetical protein
MSRELSWVLGWQDRVETTDAERFLQLFDRKELIYGGFLWADLDLSSVLPGFHSRLLLDFRAGWSAVGFSSRGDVPLGPWSAPTSARPHRSAPFGLYLLSRRRLKESVSQSHHRLAEAIHAVQPELGPVFCDPKLEVRYRGDRDFLFQPPSRTGRLLSALRYLVGGD